MFNVCSVKTICSRPRTPSVGLPRFQANAAHAGGDISKGAAMNQLEFYRLKRLFWKSAVKQDGCWSWIGAANKAGYGFICTSFDGKASKRILAHRLSWRIHKGIFDESLRVLHRCDNPQCCNPDHLFLGTQADNVADMDSKGRRGDVSGENHPKAIITEQQAMEIISLLESGHQHIHIASRFGVKKHIVSDISAGRNWKHLPRTIGKYEEEMK